MKLFREIGFFGSTFLVIGNIIGAGIFTTSGMIAQQVGESPWVLGVWVVGGVLALIGAVCYALLSVRTPRAGGEYALLYESFGPLVAFLSGWASLFIGFSAPIGAAALGLASYLSPYFNLPAGNDSLPLKLLAGAVIVLVTAFLSLGLRLGSHLHSLVTLLNLSLTLGFALLALGRTSPEQHLLPLFTSGNSAGLSAVASAIILVMFSYSGWNAAVYIAEEIRTPSRNIPLSLVSGTLLVTIGYLLINAAYFAAVPAVELAGKIAVAEITASRLWGSTGAHIVNLLIMCSILSSITAMSIAGPRVYFAMARNRLFPAWLAHVSPSKKIPLRAILFQSSVALLIISVGKFYQILLYSGFILILFSTLTVMGLFKLQPSGEENRFFLLYRFLPAVFTLVNGAVLINALLSHPRETLAGVFTLLVGLPVYYYYYGRRGSFEVRPS